METTSKEKELNMKRMSLILVLFACLIPLQARADSLKVSYNTAVFIYADGSSYLGVEAGWNGSTKVRSYIDWTAASIRAVIPSHTTIQNVTFQIVPNQYQYSTWSATIKFGVYSPQQTPEDYFNAYRSQF